MGAVVIYARNGMTWSQQALLETGDTFVELMALARDGKTLAVNQGATRRDGSTSSFAMVFTQQSNGTWSQQARIPVGITYVVDIAAGAYSDMKLSDDGNTLAVLAANWSGDPLDALSTPLISRVAPCRTTGITWHCLHAMARRGSGKPLSRADTTAAPLGAGPRWQCTALQECAVQTQQRHLDLPLIS